MSSNYMTIIHNHRLPILLSQSETSDCLTTATKRRLQWLVSCTCGAHNLVISCVQDGALSNYSSVC